MQRVTSTRATASALMILLWAVATSLSAQGVARPERGRAAEPGLVSPAPAAGPRLEPAWRSFEPRLFADSIAPSPAAAAREHTIRVSTVVIVIAAAVLLVLVLD